MNKTVSFAISEQLAERIEKIAEQENITKSELIRIYTEKFIVAYEYGNTRAAKRRKARCSK